MSKFKRVLKIILGILVISAFLVGIPIVINECYKANWDIQQRGMLPPCLDIMVQFLVQL